MVQYAAIRKFLITHRGYYCEACLAGLLHVPAEDIQRSLDEQERPDIAIAYKICRNCSSEKRVIGLRART